MPLLGCNIGEKRECRRDFLGRLQEMLIAVMRRACVSRAGGSCAEACFRGFSCLLNDQHEQTATLTYFLPTRLTRLLLT